MAKRKMITLCGEENTNTGQVVIRDLRAAGESSVDTSSSEYLYENHSSPNLSPVIGARTGIHLYNNSSDSDTVPCGFESPVTKLRSIDLNRISPELTRRIISPRQRTPEKIISPPNLPISPIIQRGSSKLKRHRISRPKLNDTKVEPPLELIVRQSGDIKSNHNHISTHREYQDQVSSVGIKPVEKTFEFSVEKAHYWKERSALFNSGLPKKRKTFKKGGLADQLQKIVKFKKSRVKIWHHEKLKNIDSPLDYAKEIVQFKFKRSWIEYGVVLIECDVCKIGNEEEDGPCILNLGVDQILNLKFKVMDIYELYPPYGIGSIMLKGKNIPYYFNVSKIIKLLRK